LGQACSELGRVAKDYLLIGVPYKQDIRVGRTTCSACGKENPPWGHVNSFDENRLLGMFPGFSVVKQSFIGQTNLQTNAFSSALLDMAGNPFGTYEQDEHCVHCSASIGEPRIRTFWEKVLTKTAVKVMQAQSLFIRAHPNWIHLLLRRKSG
jgi:hypothetical protein